MTSSHSSVSVMVWIGAILCNVGVFSMISVSYTMSWVFAMFLTILYAAGLYFLARRVEKLRGDVEHSELDIPLFMIWILFCISIFAIGLYIPQNVLSVSNGHGNSDADSSYVGIEEQIPPGSSEAVRRYVHDWNVDRSSAMMFGTNLALLGISDLYKEYDDILHIARGKTLEVVKLDGEVLSIENMAVLGNDIFALGNKVGAGGYGIQAIYAIRESGEIEVLTKERRADFGSLTAIDGKLWWISYHNEQNLWVSDGTVQGTQNLGRETHVVERSESQYVDRFVGWIFLAAIPHLAIALFLMYKKKLAGLWLNIYFGVPVFVTFIFFAAGSGKDLEMFNKVFFTVYSILVFAGCAWWMHRTRKIDRHMFWVLSLNSITVLWNLHWLFEVPYTKDALKWVLYTFGIMFLMMLSVVTMINLPMLLSGVGLGFIGWKIAAEIVDALTKPWDAHSLKITLSGFIVVFFGVGLMFVAVIYSKKRELIGEIVGAKLGLLSTQ